MTDITISGMRIDPADGKFKSGEKELVFIAGDFGPAPTVVYFDDCDKPHGALVRATSPNIGNYNTIKANAKYVRANGKGFISARDPDNLNSITQDFTDHWVNAGVDFNQYFWSCRIWGDPSSKFPTATVAGGDPILGQCLGKINWLTTPGNGPEADLVIPNIDAQGRGFSLKSNSNSIDKQPSGGLIQFPNDGVNFIKMDAPTYFGMYQSGDESAPNARDAIIEVIRLDINYGDSWQYLANPYADGDGGPPSNRTYRHMLFMGQFNEPASGWAGTQILSDYRYLAVGANARARIVVSSVATYPSAGLYVDVPAFEWTSEGVSRKFTDYERSLGHVHIIESDGTVHQNVLELEPV